MNADIRIKIASIIVGGLFALVIILYTITSVQSLIQYLRRRKDKRNSSLK